MTDSFSHHTRVLVVGGGTTGLSMAFFLARQGIRPMLVERHPSTAIMPQARAFNPRSMEIYRALGLEPEIRGRESILAGLPEMIGGDTLAGEERFRVDMLAQVRPADISPVDWAMIDQDELEIVLRAHAERAGAQVCFGTELVGLDQDAEGVTATVRDLGTGTESRIRADYLVAADGNRAGIRDRLGIGADGPGVLGHAAHFLFDADLEDVLRERRFLLAYLDRPVTGTVLVPLRQAGRWMLGVPFRPDSDESIMDFTDQRCVEAARAATGIADLRVTLVPPVPGWRCTPTEVRLGAWVADRYRAGRVFVAGDAAHVVPPTGSFGANTGIADAHNLAWKLAAVLHGQAGAGLLDTYEAERRPVAQTTMDTAVRILHARHHAEGADATAVDEVTMTFGYRYGSTAILDDPSTPDSPVEDPRLPTGRPGLRAPHVWLDRNGVKVSTMDLYDGDFVLLTGPDGDGWTEAATKTAAELGVKLNAHRIGTELRDPENRWPDAYGVTSTGATLIRPDGFVAWHTAHLPEQPERELQRALRQLLALNDEPHTASQSEGG